MTPLLIVVQQKASPMTEYAKERSMFAEMERQARPGLMLKLFLALGWRARPPRRACSDPDRSPDAISADC